MWVSVSLSLYVSVLLLGKEYDNRMDVLDLSHHNKISGPLRPGLCPVGEEIGCRGMRAIRRRNIYETHVHTEAGLSICKWLVVIICGQQGLEAARCLLLHLASIAIHKAAVPLEPAVCQPA